VPPFDEETVTELFCMPSATPVTFTEKVQMVPAASVAPVRLTVPEPAAALIVPPQVPLSPFGVATARPEGKVSVKLTPVRVDAFALVIVKLNEVLPPTAMEAAPKPLLMAGGPTTVTLAVPVLPAPPLADVTLTELFCTPPAMPVTLIPRVQDADGPSDSPERLTEDDP
jgi:hypothetical protein